MGRHAKPHNPSKEQPQETQEDAQNEHPPSRGRHAKHTKDRHRCTATTGEQAAVSS